MGYTTSKNDTLPAYRHKFERATEVCCTSSDGNGLTLRAHKSHEYSCCGPIDSSGEGQGDHNSRGAYYRHTATQGCCGATDATATAVYNWTTHDYWIQQPSNTDKDREQKMCCNGVDETDTSNTANDGNSNGAFCCGDNMLKLSDYNGQANKRARVRSGKTVP